MLNQAAKPLCSHRSHQKRITQEEKGQGHVQRPEKIRKSEGTVGTGDGKRRFGNDVDGLQVFSSCSQPFPGGPRWEHSPPPPSPLARARRRAFCTWGAVVSADELPVCDHCDQPARAHRRTCSSSYCEGYQDALDAVDGIAGRAYDLGEEAGRLAAIRAEVEYFVWLVGTMPTEMGAEPFSKRRRRELAKLRAQAADCRRWLEATR